MFEQYRDNNEKQTNNDNKLLCAGFMNGLVF